MDIYEKIFRILILTVLISIRTRAQNCTEKLYKIRNLTCSAYGPYGTCVEYKKQEFYELNCNNIVDSIQAEHLEDIYKINIYNSSINVKTGIFSSFTNLESITIHGSNIKSIDPDVFVNLTKLMSLNFTENDIDVLYETPFGNGTLIELLDLSKNKISAIEDILLEGLPNLNKLFLGNNKISDASPLMNDCRNLNTLDLSYNDLDQIELTTGCSQLVHLKLNNNNINKLSAKVEEALELESLDLSSNYIDSIKDLDLEHFINIKYLNLSNNPLFNTDELPVDFFYNKQDLKYLNLSNTGLQTITLGTFTKLENLKVLDLSFNSLESLPSGLFHDLRALRKLYLNNNQFSFFNYDGFAAGLIINLDNNIWDCDTLSDIARTLRSKYVYIGPGSTHNKTNIFGVSCFETEEISDKRRNISVEEFDSIFNKIEENMQDVFEQQEKLFNLSVIYQQNQRDYYNKFFKDLQNNMEEVMVKNNYTERTEKLTEDNQKSINFEHTYKSMVVGIYFILFILTAGFLLFIFIIFKNYKSAKNNRDEFQILNNFEV